MRGHEPLAIVLHERQQVGALLGWVLGQFLAGIALALAAMLAWQLLSATGLAPEPLERRPVQSMGGLTVLPDIALDEIDAAARAMLADKPVGFIYGVGPATQEKLVQRGFRLISDLQRAGEVMTARGCTCVSAKLIRSPARSCARRSRRRWTTSCTGASSGGTRRCGRRWQKRRAHRGEHV